MNGLIGKSLSHYRIMGWIDTGGMGEVYRARDTRLEREVAVKALPPAFSSDPGRLRRFIREAKVLASLNHPNINAIYGLEELPSGERFLVLELIEGETVAERLKRGAMDIPEALRICGAIAEALEAAHERGVIHRDLKPRNVMLAAHGAVKVLDFGLARHVRCTVDGRETNTGTTLSVTEPGRVMGTPGYMSPEQVRGEEQDRRTDIFAFGCVLFECLTGLRAFVGSTEMDAMAAALTGEPLWSALPRDTPQSIRELLARCLEKEVSQRLRDIGQARVEIEQARGGQPAAVVVANRPTEPHLVSICLAVLPFQDLGTTGDTKTENQVLANGLAETVSAALARRTDIQIIPPSATSSRTFIDDDLRRIGRTLGANLLLRGAVRRSGDQVRVSYSLLMPDRSFQVAGDTVDGSVRNLFAVEDRLIDSVVRSLGSRLDTRGPQSHHDARDPAAHEHYLQALGYLQRFEDGASVDGAISLLDQLLQAEGHGAHVYAALGRAYLCKYKLTKEPTWEDKARAACKKARELEPRSPDVLVTLGNLHVSLGRPSEAIRDFQSALRVRPSHPEALLGLSEAYEAAGRLHEAEQACREAIAQRPQYWGGYNRLGVLCFARGDYERAIEFWSRVVELTPDNVRGFNNLGAAYFQMGRYPEALATYHRSIEILPSAVAFSSLGTVHFFLRNYVEAAAMFEKGAALRPNDPRMWGNLGDAYRWMSGFEERAVATFERAINMQQDLLGLNPKDAEGWSDLAGWLAKVGRRREAGEAIRRALKLNPKDVRVMATAGQVYHLAGRRAKALEWLKRAVDRGYNARELLADPDLQALHIAPLFRGLITDESRDRTRTWPS